MSYALADYLIARHRYPFLKKSPIWIDKESSSLCLEIIQEMGPEADYILAEARTLLRERSPSMA